MTDDGPGDDPPDPGLDPTRSPGFGAGHGGLEAIDVGRDVTIGEATPEELTASDTSQVADAPMEVLVAQLREGDLVERRRAALALGEREVGSEAIDALAAAVRGDEDAEVRQFAVEALATVGGEDAEAVALDAMRDENPWVRAEAVVALDRLDRSGRADRIAAALDDDHHAVRRNAAISRFKHRGEAMLPELLAQLDDPSERVREWAAHLLGGIDDDRARAALERAAATDESHIVRATAHRARGVDPDRFRRRFTGAMDAGDQPLPGEDRLNRQPDL